MSFLSWTISSTGLLSLRNSCSICFLDYLETHKRQEGFLDLRGHRAQRVVVAMGTHKLVVCWVALEEAAVILIGGSCLAPTHPRGPECRRSARVLPQQKPSSLPLLFLLTAFFPWCLADLSLMPFGLSGYFRDLILPRSSKVGEIAGMTNCSLCSSPQKTGTLQWK